ncbi:MAG: Glycosyl transferase family 39 [Candidatus Levybacteria bacterium GW2011_GWA2_40_16]|nr:MAG: Glycosyl transferase family 39 [Candidatus Levybacteria bacterium GW2011_GWA2_40_16]
MTNESSDYNSYSYYRIKIKNWLIKYKYLILVFIFYLILNSLFLTKLPIFNDEAIYLDWGWTAAHWPGYLYQSMADGKQPLIMWLFGIASNFASDPLLSGRFASVLLGGFSLIGLYLTAKTLFNEKVGLFASLIFAVTPIFVFYNRQALFEAGLIFSIIWSFYYFLKFIQKPDYKNASLLGIFFGIGLFIKTTILIFAFPMTLILLWQIVIKKRSELTTPAIISIGAFLAVDALILINPVFWEALSSNSRYSYTFSDLLRFPIISWMNNLIGFFEIGLFFITPLVFIISLIGIFLIAKLKELDKAIFIFVFCISLLMEIILTRSQSQRYLVSFLPFLTICSAYVLDKLWNLKK